ncbi:Uncharacterised protein [Kingella potus]|uniref:ACP-like domain-containing protein n=1 Tax=Kingella potus TaxID=265175 RepID=A0A377R277_9NEIS|nr:adhesin [Kingella potus]STR02867.1 Uncharacterised protein [Kingella potus]
MKLLSAVVLSSLVALSGTAAAANDNPTVAKKSVSYRCQQGKRINVTYGFNKQGLPTYASARLNGRTRVMEIDLARSDNVGTFFGEAGGYRLDTDVLDSKNVRTQPMMITSPDDRILFKSCSPRR